MSRSDDSHDAPGGGEIVLECDLPAPPAKVWRALTVPALLAQWLTADGIPSPATAAPLPEGQRAADGCAAEHPDVELLHSEPDRCLRYRWRTYESSAAGEGWMDSELSFELTPGRTGGTHLRIVHGGFRTATVMRMAGRTVSLAARQAAGRPPVVACAPCASWTLLRRAA